jgi:hypothetical protein
MFARQLAGGDVIEPVGGEVNLGGEDLARVLLVGLERDRRVGERLGEDFFRFDALVALQELARGVELCG